jgi:Holliday junction resolvase RusA-like endonuclease
MGQVIMQRSKADMLGGSHEEERQKETKVLEYETHTKPVPQNRKLARGKGSRLYLNAEYSKAWTTIANEWKSQSTDSIIDRKIAVQIQFGWPRMDLDSCIKPILDTLQGIAYTNDKQVESLLISRSRKDEIKVQLTEY